MNELQCLGEGTKCQGQGYVLQPLQGKPWRREQDLLQAPLTLWLSLQPSVEALEPNVS